MAPNISEIMECVLTHNKTKNMYGLVMSKCHTEKKKVRIVYAKQWPQEKINIIPFDISILYKKTQWDQLHIDQITGQHLIESIRSLDVPVNVITTQKDLKDPKGIENLEIMDKNEMIELFRKFRQNNQIQFQSKKSKAMQELEDQMPLYLQHITEAGSIDYYPPGDESDHLSKGLLMCCFAFRNILESGDDGIFVGGPMRGKHKQKRFIGMGDGRKDAALVNALSGPPGRITHYY